MFRRVFPKKSNDGTRRHRKQASTSYHAATSTPNVSGVCAGADTGAGAGAGGQWPDVSVIVVERSVSGPILVSDESIADLAETFRKQCSCRSRASCSQQEQSPRTSCCALRAVSRSEQCERCEESSEGVQQLYFNADAKKSDSSGPAGRCINEECNRTCEMKTVTSAMLTKVEKEVMNRSCGKIVMDSAGACSLADSASGSCDAARAHYYHNKLLSTLQILQNKEETIRVQAESLAVAEGRIAALAARAAALRRDIDNKNTELNCLRKTMDNCKLEKTDVSVMAATQEAGEQTELVNTLQNNLSVIEDLYRECFYETAKQEGLIELLRSSLVEVRLMDKRKAADIDRLQHALHSQHSTRDTCQDLAMEVDTLKTEISNFLNNSTNNDSGMWEARSEGTGGGAGAGAGMQEELHDVMEQLLRLRGMLASGCICGLEEENMRLKQSNETLEVKIGEMQHNMSELESELMNKDHADARYKEELETKEKELLEIRRQLAAVQEGSRDHSSTCDTLTLQLQQAQALVEDKTTELAQVREQNDIQEATIKELKQELERADKIIKEKCKVRSEVSYLTQQVSLWRAQLCDSERRVRALDDELRRARAHAAHIDACYRQKAGSVAELQAQLEEAYARGAAMCGETRHVVAAVRHWVRRMRDKHREQETLIKEKETILESLQLRIEERQNDTQRTSVSENEPSCSKCSSSRNERSRSGPSELPSCCPKPAKRVYYGTSGSEMASCSSAPVPPRRMLRKKLCGSQRCGCGSRDAGVQQPVRREAGSGAEAAPAPPSPAGPAPPSPAGPAPPSPAGPAPPARCPQLDTRHVCVRLERAPRDISPTEQLYLRVEELAEGLADAQRRWARARDPR